MNKPDRIHSILLSVLFMLFLGVAVSLVPSSQSIQAKEDGTKLEKVAGSRPGEPQPGGPLSPVGSGFTYQGQLKDGGSPANGQYDLIFILYDAENAGNQVGSPITRLNQTVANGLVAQTLDFGAGVFSGEARWLDVQVRQAGGGSYTTLSPRQAITAVPNALTLVPGAVITGSVSGLAALVVTNTHTSSGAGISSYASGTQSRGVRGIANNGEGAVGVRGDSNSGWGVWGSSSAPTNSIGVHGTSNTGHGGYFSTNSTIGGHGVFGQSFSTNGFGVYGVTGATGSGAGVFGESTNTSGRGVWGRANGAIGGWGVFGEATNGRGVYGLSTTGYGVLGNTAGGGSVAGLFGESTGLQGTGVWGRANNGSSAYGVWGQSTNGNGVRGDSTSGYGVYGFTGGDIGVAGVFGESTSANGYGVWGRANGIEANGVVGTSSNGYGVFGSTGGTLKAGVYGYGGSSSPGVHGFSVENLGVYGQATGSDAVGVAGEANNGASAFGVWGASTSGYAGYFTGRVHTQGNFSATGSKNFKIDHPLDPANKYLYHASIESPDVMNMYNGNVTLDAKGEAWVQMPAYFEALNRDFRYQLTSIGAPAPNLYVSEKVKGNRFKIAGGQAGIEVSWQITGIRQDPYVNDHPTPVEADKPADEKGTYLYPQGYGQPETKGVDYERIKQMEQTQPKEPKPQLPNPDRNR